MKLKRKVPLVLVAAAALTDDQRALAQFIFAREPARDLEQLSRGLDRVLTRLADPRLGTLRAAALERWPAGS